MPFAHSHRREIPILSFYRSSCAVLIIQIFFAAARGALVVTHPVRVKIQAVVMDMSIFRICMLSYFHTALCWTLAAADGIDEKTFPFVLTSFLDLTANSFKLNTVHLV